MKLPKISELKNISADEKAHLQDLEASIQDAFLAAQIAAAEDHIDSEDMATGSIVVALSAVARQLVAAANDQNVKLTPEAFADLAREALAWAINRKLENSENIIH